MYLNALKESLVNIPICTARSSAAGERMFPQGRRPLQQGVYEADSSASSSGTGMPAPSRNLRTSSAR
jgi:hypothetical protein